jgi:hypothetical protein
MDPNTVDSSDSVFTSLLAVDHVMASLGHTSWPLTASRIWPQLTIEHSLLPCLLVCRTIGFGSWYIASAQTQQRTPSPTVLPSLHVYLLQRSCDLVAMEMCLHSHYLATTFSAGLTILALSGHVTMSCMNQMNSRI